MLSCCCLVVRFAAAAAAFYYVTKLLNISDFCKKNLKNPQKKVRVKQTKLSRARRRNIRQIARRL